MATASASSSSVSGGGHFSREHSQRLRQLAIVDTGIPFPKNKLQKGTGKGRRIVLVVCGAFSPVTLSHLRMFEQARDYGRANDMNIIGGYFSPVTDAYKKKGLVSATHRVKMTELAVESSDWLMVDTWESLQLEYQTTIAVLDHFRHCLNKDTKEDPIEVRLVCGADLLESFNTPGVWAAEDIQDIVSNYGLMVLERGNSKVALIIQDHDVLYRYQKNINIVVQDIQNDISSTKIRKNLSRGQSVKYLTPDPVIKYIEENNLYKAPSS
jgi:nicotinamide mononucleotide adenylyltransferase